MSDVIEILSGDDLLGMRAACKLAAFMLTEVGKIVRPGISTQLIDDEVVRLAKAHGAKNGPLGYHGFPKSVCTSVNEVVCHGIPSSKIILREGDIINIDVSPVLNGFYGDTSKMFFVGNPSAQARELVEVTEQCLWAGIREVAPEKRIGDIGASIQEIAESHGFSVVRDFVGHGIGKVFHHPTLQIPHYGKRGTGRRLVEGMIFTIEPMINQGVWQVEVLGDNWTAVTKDRKLSAQCEHTVRVSKTGVEVLTLREDEVPQL
ncbi:MAG TPA: type I methionyl aminopeptidase [Myxococcota bacterium]|nr:type I methionyl aminopeptidase [Myxococcota bacterium]